MSETLRFIAIPPLIPQRAVMEAHAIHAMMLITTSISRIENPARHSFEAELGKLILIGGSAITPCIL